MRLATLGTSTGLLLPALAQCVKDHPVPSGNRHTCALEQELPLCEGVLLCATGCRPLLCTQAVQERHNELVEDRLAPPPICIEGSWQVLDATGSAQVTVVCMSCRFCHAAG